MSLPDSTHSTMSLPDSTSLYYDRLKYSYIQIILMIHQMLDFKLIQFHYIPESSRDKAAPDIGGRCSTVPKQTFEALAMYLCELAIQDSNRYLKYCPFIIAASAVSLASQVGQW